MCLVLSCLELVAEHDLELVILSFPNAGVTGCYYAWFNVVLGLNPELCSC